MSFNYFFFPNLVIDIDVELMLDQCHNNAPWTETFFLKQRKHANFTISTKFL